MGRGRTLSKGKMKANDTRSRTRGVIMSEVGHLVVLELGVYRKSIGIGSPQDSTDKGFNFQGITIPKKSN